MNVGAFIRQYLRERDGSSKVSILTHPVFWVVLGVKVAAIFFVSATVPAEHYGVFVSYFLDSQFSNPYEHFAGTETVFPFPALMLFMLAASKLVVGFFIPFDPFVLHIPVLLADFAIFLILARWFKTKQKKVLWYYWCSPILFAVSYLAGFLDLVPIALLFAFLYFFFKDRYLVAFVLLGLALATKTGLVILLPFILVYLLKEHEPLTRIFGYVALSGGIYALFNSLYMASPGFWQTTLSSGQSLTSNMNLDFGGAVIYIAPLVYLGLILGSFAFQRLNKDIFLMFLAFALGMVTLVVLPEAGWYSWVVPFFVYFFVKESGAGVYPFVLLNLFFFAYFLLTPNSLFLEAFAAVPPANLGDTPVNLAFTLLQGTLLLNCIWIYRLGIQSGIKHKILYKPYLVGIAGDSASGKSTVASLLSQVLGAHNTLEVAGDDMHKWERGDPHWLQMTHLHPGANRLHDDMQHALQLRRNESVVRRLYDHALGRFTLPERVRPKNVIIFQGLHALYLNRARTLLDLKIFLSPDEELRRQWKVERDMFERGHAKEQVLQELEARVADAEKYIREQQRHADVVIALSRRGTRETLEIACDNSINLDPLLSVLQERTSLEILHEHTSEGQRLTAAGAVTSESIDELAYELVPEIWEINRRELRWEEGLNGVIQLFLAYVIFHKAKLDHDLS